MKTREKMLFIFLLIFSIKYTMALILPGTNIFEKEYADVKMWCNSNDSSRLSFYNVSKEFREQTKIINETMIELDLKNVSATDTTVTCRWDHTIGVDMRRIVVGTVPKPVENFRCLSYDFNYFVCQFKMPHNYVKVKYNVSYSVDHSTYFCPEQRPERDIWTCNITLASGKYRQVHDRHIFSINATNKLGTTILKETVNHFENVIPGKPSLKVSVRGPHEALMTWDVHKTLYRDTGLVFKIRIVDNYDPNNWVELDTSEVKSISETKYSFELNNLYAYTWYEVQLYLKVRKAADTIEMWTQVNSTFQTDRKKPDDPPTVDVGSFRPQFTYNMSATWFVIYWKGVPKQRANADKLHYVVTEARKNGKIVDIQPVEITEYSAKFVQDEKADYTFTLHTVNEKGTSEENATITVPKKDYPLPHLKKVYKDMNYILSWNEPETTYDLEIRDYTIFSCTSASETSDQCKGDFDFVHVSRHERSYTYTPRTADNMNFAISANYKNGGSSGMIWAMCTASTSSDFGILKPKALPHNGTTIKLDWSLECVYSAMVEGFRLKYCPIFINGSCKEPMKVLNISGSLSEYYLNNLKPYTTYGIWMIMYSARKEGPESDNPVDITTLESAPSPPRKLTLISKTNNSIELQWEQPERHNGILTCYKVYYNNEVDKVTTDPNAPNITWTLKNLSSYKEYKIYVTASTTTESNPSNDISVRTSIGTPSTTNQVIKLGDTLTWNKPTVPSGPIDFYEFKVSILGRGDIIEESKIYRIVKTRCTLQQNLENFCRNNWKQVNFSVRAVNIVPDESGGGQDVEDYPSSRFADEFKCNETTRFFDPVDSNLRYLRAEWSSPLTTNCEYPEKLPTMTILFSPFVFGALAIFIYYMSKKYIRMKDIGIAFPPGLTDLDQESGPKGCDNVISRDDINQSEESLYKNENHKLLDSKRLSAGYVNGFDRTDKSHTAEFDDSSIEAIPAEVDSSSSRHESVEMSDMSDSMTNSPADSPNINLREIIMHPPMMTQQQAPQSRNMAKKPIIINGYVQHDSFNSFVAEPTIPYTSLESVANTIIPTNINSAVDSNEIIKHKDIRSINGGPQENICGYVTHKQLSEFGHRQQ